MAIDLYARYFGETWGEKLYDDDYVNELMLAHPNAAEPSDAEDRTSPNSNTMTATLTNRRLLSRLRAFVRSDSSTGAAHALQQAHPTRKSIHPAQGEASSPCRV